MGIIKYKVVNCKYLTIRQRPTKESKAVAYLKAGDIVNVIRNKSVKTNNNVWHKCTKGYVSSKCLKRITPNYLKRVTKNADLVYNKIVKIGCKHKRGAYSYADIKKKKITTCATAVSAVLQESGILKQNKLIDHTPRGGTKSTISQCLTGTKNLINGTYRIVKVMSLYKDIPSIYNKKGVVYVYDSNIAVNAGDGYIYSCNNGETQLDNGHYVKNKMKSGYCFTHKILYAIVPNT